MEANNIINKCEICGSEAIFICYECMSYLCDNCSKFIHEKKLNSQHKIEKVDYFAPMETKCIKHKKIPITLFCLNEKSKRNFFLIFRITVSSMLFFGFA